MQNLTIITNLNITNLQIYRNDFEPQIDEINKGNLNINNEFLFRFKR